MAREKDGVLQLDKEAGGRIWVITMNRPERLNALNGELRRALYETYWEFAQDDDAWVSILTGTGRAFCTGQTCGNERTVTPRPRPVCRIDGAAPRPSAEYLPAVRADQLLEADDRGSQWGCRGRWIQSGAAV